VNCSVGQRRRPVSEHEPTCIGRVQHVLGAQVTVALDTHLAGVAPIFRGRLQPLGQVGSLVRLPQGLVDLIGQVSLLGIAELSGVQPPADVVQTGERWLQVQLLGEVDRATGRFTRGIGSYPGLDDPVHFATAEDLEAVFPGRVATSCASDGSRLRNPFRCVSAQLDSLSAMQQPSDQPAPGRRAQSHHCYRASQEAGGPPRILSSSMRTANTLMRLAQTPPCIRF
jgi:hypothetical protein